jgi:ribosome-associated translation inhibitor RaiA
MQIEIQALTFTLTEGLRDHAERRLRFAFGSTSGKVRGVVMRLADENGPRGGVDKRCSIRVTVSGIPAVVVEQRETDLYVAIDRAADRAGRAVARRLKSALADRRDGKPAAVAGRTASQLY